MTGGGLVSVVLPAYKAQITIKRCLDLLTRQANVAIEIIVVDSSDDDETERIVTTAFPQVSYIHHDSRLFAHEAQGMGAEQAAGELLLFMDPDVYAPPRWLEKLVLARKKLSGVVTGGLRSYGESWMEMGHHLCKFDLWLPRGETRVTEMCPTANLLCLRQEYEQVGGLERNIWLGDLVLSWRFIDAKIPLWFVPEIVAHHHHLGDLNVLLEQRFIRGTEFSGLRRNHEGWGRTRILLNLVLTVLPVRLISQLRRGLQNSSQAGYRGDFLKSFPIIAAGQSAWLIGEIHATLQLLLHKAVHRT